MFNERSADYIVIDDVPYERFIGFKSIVGCQHQFNLTDKYVKKLRFTDWHKPCIILTNEDMDYRNKMPWDVRNWFDQNCTTINLTQALF
jgi:hypothetical protein